MTARHLIVLLIVAAEASLVFYGAAVAVAGSFGVSKSTAGGGTSVTAPASWGRGAPGSGPGSLGARAARGLPPSSQLLLYSVPHAQGAVPNAFWLPSVAGADPRTVPPIAGPVAVAGLSGGAAPSASLGGGGGSSSSNSGETITNSAPTPGDLTDDPPIDDVQDPAPVPLPGAAWLLLGGLFGVLGLRRKKG